MGYHIKNKTVGRRPDGLAIPTGSSTDRPDDPVIGIIRYNTTINTFEFWDGSDFKPIGIQDEITLVFDQDSGDGSTLIFSMSQSVSAPTQILVFIGGVFQIPTTDYTVSGVNITFTSAPPSDNEIIIIHNIGSTVIT